MFFASLPAHVQQSLFDSTAYISTLTNPDYTAANATLAAAMTSIVTLIELRYEPRSAT